MANIVHTNSLAFDSILDDIKNYMANAENLPITKEDLNESSFMGRFASAMASLYNQLRMQINDVMDESIMHSALREDSIKYLAQSQLAYHPKRKIAPQHPKGELFEFKHNSTISNHAILGNINIGGQSYPISIIGDLTSNGETTKCRLGIGSWRGIDIHLNADLGHYEPFHTFHVDEEPDVIDDSGTVCVSITRNSQTDYHPLKIINNLYELTALRQLKSSADKDESEEEIRKRQEEYGIHAHEIVLVTSNFHGGLDINFGDGLIFGNALYSVTSNERLQGRSDRKIHVKYFVTPGFIPNFNFVPNAISWDPSYVDTSWFGSSFNATMANGIDQESTASIKTLSPYVAMANQRIMTNEDFITRVRRIPQIKSCNSVPEHTLPQNRLITTGRHADDGVPTLVPTATFKLTGLTAQSMVKDGVKWRNTVEEGQNEPVEGNIYIVDKGQHVPTRYFRFGHIPDKIDHEVMIEPNIDPSNVYELLANGTADDALESPPEIRAEQQELDITGYYFGNNRVSVSIDDIRNFFNTNHWRPNSTEPMVFIAYHGDKDTSTITTTFTPWEELNVDDVPFVPSDLFQPLTQLEWDLNYHRQYNFDTLLGFMRVKVIPPSPESVEFKLTVLLKQNMDVNARTQWEVDEIIRGIITSYCWELGVKLDLGKIVADIVSLDEVAQCYIHHPYENKQYGENQYINPTEIQINYQTDFAKYRFGTAQQEVGNA